MVCFIFSLVLAALSLCCYMPASLLSVVRLLIAVVSPVAEHGLERVQALLVVAQGLQSTVSVAVAHRLRCPRHVGFSWARDRTHVPCTGRWILYHWTTGNVSCW